ncbi:hypothetical protein BZG02_05350 [Labilibaculum filiforme]|uniref:Uncharacterized protein n=1 Tax=Labilibaculum filiforme TaxID=1940526 RepID=A0A2N3I1Q6_9BACT|nr:hypothetical protein [Labilibaculum filiforme]PKQ64249.1 hypothetical protein BZG02_05350 [Labilibaculum filiforme]
MKDIVKKKAVLKRELIIFIVALIIAFALNMYSIIAYQTPWTELITSLGFVVIFALLFYLVALVVRLVLKGIKLVK